VNFGKRFHGHEIGFFQHTVEHCDSLHVTSSRLF
jgi:hypothetical protein